MRGYRATVLLLLLAIHRSGTVLASPTGTVEGAQLDQRCTRDRECETRVDSSHCHLGLCRCLPFFAAYNGTHCLEATLLDEECLVDEQCTLKVANSGCLDGFCGCKDGFLQFRRHTCLGPAKIGQVCYEHAHCRLWQESSHCDFLIPNLFGRCQCTAPMRRENDTCRPDDLVRPPPLFSDAQATTTVEDREEDKETGVQIAWLKNATAQSTYPTSSADSTSQSVDSTDRADEDDAIIVEAVSESANNAWMSALATKADRQDDATTPVSLGYDCVSELECRLADPYSRCVDGVCDCGFRGENASCGARNTGCAAGTFQCASSGNCISWFFVCDGRADCSDGSDERCSQREFGCPEQAFRCSGSEVCVSRALMCDGKPDCPHGEDESGCNDRRRCPEGAFRCNNGQCLPAYEFCNAVVSCRDGSDEPRAACRTRAGYRGRVGTRHCPFRCDNGRCRSDAIACSGRDGCGDGSDERRCSVCRCAAFDDSWKRHIGASSTGFHQRYRRRNVEGSRGR